MKKHVFRLSLKLCFAVVILYGATVTSQVSSSDVVYGGKSFTWGVSMGSYDHVVLFRKNGTFCESLEEQDWQTKVTGHYKKVKDKILMEYLDSSEENDTIFFETDEEGYESIYYAGAQMVKMIVPNTVPKGYYDFSSASSSGGMGTGLVYVGTQSYEGYNFYDNGTFDRKASGGVMVSGNNVAGGTSSDSSGKGKYTIKNGLLTLYYDNGQIEKNSFFYEKITDGEISMVAINGSIFFYGDDDENTEEESDTVQKEASQDIDVSKTLESSGQDVLKSIKKAHGGEAIDQLKGLKTEVVISGIKFQVLMDVEQNHIRLESQTPNFEYVEQLEGNKGWVYRSGVYREMPPYRIKELKATFLGGIFGLQKSVMDRATLLDLRQTDDNIMLITLMVDERTLGYVVNKNEHTIVATFILKDGKNEITYLKDLTKTDGLLLPFSEVTEAEGATVEVLYKTYTINPVFKDSDWSKPE
ncbi:hypothetical protein [Costertonia aggregata]|uniref:Uncharacterized protein n=1 Tax=Costertonia aggregata TaxID=343403 RepID=A0A7H9AMY7_9FLAO|nr:hypothetical protein [Costertonia aggregata]QLG44764.1 hypothetical protein HYG79_05175 [Costertonia aggregata]